MLGRYIQVLRRPGAARFSGAGLVGRLQIAMAALSMVLLIASVRQSYTVAGLVSALYAVSASVLGPQVSRQIDRRGQRRVVPFQLAVHVPAVAGLVSVAVWTIHDWPIFVLAVLAGASQPAVGALVRTRWSALLSGTPQLRTAFAWEALVDEVVFIIGPFLATAIALQVSPSAAVLTSTGFLALGAVLLLVQTGTEPAPSGMASRQHGRPAVLLPGMFGIYLIFVLLGGLFGSFEVATIAFAKQQGHPGAVGPMFAAFSVASLAAGLVFGAARARSSLLTPFTWSLIGVATVTLPLPLLGNLVLVGAGLALCGLVCAPMSITGMALVDRIVPGHRLTEAMSWTTSGMALGVAAATPLTGWVIDRAGAQVAYWITAGCAVGTFVVGLVVRPSLARAEAAAIAVAAGRSRTGAQALAT